jgi:hypothetical protein
VTPPTSDADWVSDRLAEARARKEAMARHPAGQTTGQLLAQDPGPFLPAIPAFGENAGEVYAELLDVLVTKQEDYGPRAINDSPGGPLLGINVRLHDKLSRAENLRSQAADYAPAHESIRDTYLDLANYAVIALMVLDGTWPQ